MDQAIIDSFLTPTTFDLDLELPGSVLLGQHILTVELPPQGLYEGTSGSKGIEVVQASPRLKVRSPTFTFLPRSVGISGEVTSALGPLRNAKVTLKLRDNQTTVRTDDRGRFSGSLALSLGQLFLGPQTLQITVQPGEPWHSAISTQVAVFIVNVANLGVLSIAVSYFAFLLAMIWRRQRYRSSPVPAHEPAPLLPGTQGTPVVTPLVSAPAWAYIDPNTPRGRIVSAYHRAARFLESDLGVSFQPHYTFRDFLATIGSHVRTAFAELTRITERALYGVYGYDEQEARHAEELARATQGEGT